jgi:Tfp pilus assembly protein PilX
LDRKRLTPGFGDSRGAILLGAVIVVFVTVVLGLALFDLAVVDNRLILGSDCDARAFYAAEAGLQVAYRDLVNGTAIGSVDFDGILGNSSYASRSNLTAYVNRPLSGSGAQPTAFTVQAQTNVPLSTITLYSTGTATGSCPGGPGSSTVRASVKKNAGGGHSFIGLDHFLTGGSGFLLDSFDSSLGAYNCLGGSAGCSVPSGTHNLCQQTTSPFTCAVDVWTNGPGRTTLDGGPIYANLTSASGEVRIKSGGTLYGSLTYDTVDGSVTGVPANVKGGIIGQTGISGITLPPVPWPGVDASGNHGQDCRTHGGFSTAAYVSGRVTGSYSYDDVSGTFIASGNLTIDPGASAAQFCFSSFSTAGRDLTIPNTVTKAVEIYIGSATDSSTIGQALLSGNVVNSTGQSKYLRIFSISNKGNDDVWITSGTGSFAYVYAPYGQVQIKGNGAFFGAAFGQQLEANGGSQLHFDQALMAVGLPGLTGGTGGTYTPLQNWTQCRNSACT